MATRRALVLVDGVLAEMPQGDNLAGAGGGGALPAGGGAGQVLTKTSSADGDAAWQAPVSDRRPFSGMGG